MTCKMRFAPLTALLVAWLGAAAPSMAADILRPSDLNKNREKYDGQMVVVDAILLIDLGHGSHLKAIYDSNSRRVWHHFKAKLLGRRYWLNNPDQGCVSIDNPELVWDSIKDPKYRHVRIKGELIARYESVYDYISGTCATGTGIWIEEILEVH